MREGASCVNEERMTNCTAFLNEAGTMKHATFMRREEGNDKYQLYLYKGSGILMHKREGQLYMGYLLLLLVQ
jgi:hypothetical protein